MAMESWNDEGSIHSFDLYHKNVSIFCLIGRPVYGESGDLVCTKPFPSMPTHFWNDEDGIKYKKAYFSKFEGNVMFMRNGTFVSIRLSHASCGWVPYIWEPSAEISHNWLGESGLKMPVGH